MEENYDVGRGLTNLTQLVSYFSEVLRINYEFPKIIGLTWFPRKGIGINSRRVQQQFHGLRMSHVGLSACCCRDKTVTQEQRQDTTMLR